MFDNSSIYPNRLSKHDLLWEDKKSVKKCCAKKCEKYQKTQIFIFTKKTVKIRQKVYTFCSLHSTTKTLRRVRNKFCPRVPPLLETLYPKDCNKYLPQDCINSPASGKAFCRKQSRGSAYERDVSQKEISRSVALGLHRNYLYKEVSVLISLKNS